MQLLTILILMFTCLCNLEAVNLFKKHHHQKKILTTITARYPVKGPLGCEKLCLELADSCVAVNVLYTNHQYVCDVMATFRYSDEEVEELMTSNPNGKLIIKQGNSYMSFQSYVSGEVIAVQRSSKDKCDNEIFVLTNTIYY
ncbi:hypothetical protein LSH36_344g04018 [Paralvinella palmiformis]|uniref:Apple domain-containing protein n=1 Tax=Paralvinella palmiformis TaxID=53620 RepID=A0AAD9MZW3_9ANNE|nr:hypothetical protein LSH36_344g04018 [Paralvinella palmiformis]